MSLVYSMLMSGCEHQTLGVLRSYLCIHVQPESAPNTKGGSRFHVFMVMIKFIQWSQNPQTLPLELDIYLQNGWLSCHGNTSNLGAVNWNISPGNHLDLDYYLNRIGFGLLYTFTFGIFGVGYIVDWCRFPILLKRYNKSKEIGHTSHKHLDDAYLLWFPLGFLGFHHFYLNRPVWGFLYMFTFGLLGIGWLIDLCRMWKLVENCNKEIDERVHLTRNNRSVANPNYIPGQYYGNMPTSTVGGHVPVSYGQFGPCPPGYSNPNPGIYPTQQNGYGSVPGMNEQPPPYEAASIPTKGH